MVNDLKPERDHQLGEFNGSYYYWPTKTTKPDPEHNVITKTKRNKLQLYGSKDFIEASREIQKILQNSHRA